MATLTHHEPCNAHLQGQVLRVRQLQRRPEVLDHLLERVDLPLLVMDAALQMTELPLRLVQEDAAGRRVAPSLGAVLLQPTEGGISERRRW